MANFDRFKREYRCTEDKSAGDLLPEPASIPPEVIAVVSELGGRSFNQGIYRVVRADDMHVATAAAKLAFPELARRIVVFGFDWLGRMFAADSGRLSEGVPQTLMLEIGAGESMQIPADAITFHDIELVDYADDALARQFFNDWRAISPAPLRHDQCVGYKVPLFLGGSDALENLELCDLSVYWHICGQLRNKAMTLKKGQTISDVTIN